MVYKECGHQTTCLTFNVTVPRILECTDGCFCEDSTVFYNGSCTAPDICGMELFYIYILLY